jgi:hypothetical protein
MSFEAGVRAMRAVHELGKTCRDLGALESAMADLTANGDCEAAAVAYEWYVRVAEAEDAAALAEQATWHRDKAA